MTTLEYLDELLGLSAQIRAISDCTIQTDELKAGDHIVNVTEGEHEFWKILKTEPTDERGNWWRITARCGPRIHRLECSPKHAWPTVKATR